MKIYITNLGFENYLWQSCHASSTIAIHEDEDTWPLWLAGDREAYIDRCLATKKTAAGIRPTRPVASGWFNLASVISSTEGDLWIHRQKNELWWTFSLPGELGVSFEPGFKPGDQVYILSKRVEPWSNKTKNGNRLEWPGLHVKAQKFLFTERTFQRLSDDNAAYALALISGNDLSPWHSRPAWMEMAKAAGRNPATTFSPKQRAILEMATTARDTAAGANGQEALRKIKNKEFRFTSMQEAERYIKRLVESQEGLCAITGLPLQYRGEHDDEQLLCSLDRIDSSGHYEEENLQVVCRFVNRWKSDENNDEFRRLISLVRSTGGIGPAVGQANGHG